MVKSNESEETLMMCGRDFESREDGAYVKEEKKKLTNGDKFRSMTNEEIANMIKEGTCANCAYQKAECTDITCEERILAYLNQEV